MKIGKTIYVVDRKKWRSWLAKNHKKEKEIWLVFYKKASGKPRLPYNDAVEEALCYGWIDSIVKTLDEHSVAQRFSPRKSTSFLSQLNKERIHTMIDQKKMTPSGLKAVSHAFDKTEKDRFVIPSDTLKALRADKDVWKNFEKFPDDYKRVRIAYIEYQRKHSKEMYNKALNNFIKKTKNNKKFGMLK